MSQPQDAPPPMPLWVKVLGIIGLIVIVLIAIMLLSGGEHGPGRHAPSGAYHEVQQA